MTKTFCDRCGAELLREPRLCNVSLAIETQSPTASDYMNKDFCFSCARELMRILRKGLFLPPDPKEPRGLLSGATLGKPL
jgi:hypothetical protein